MLSKIPYHGTQAEKIETLSVVKPVTNVKSNNENTTTGNHNILCYNAVNTDSSCAISSKRLSSRDGNDYVSQKQKEDHAQSSL